MARAWTCLTMPETHGAFLQSGLDELVRVDPGLLPKGRYGCPVCWSENMPGYVRPASITEASRLGRQISEV